MYLIHTYLVGSLFDVNRCLSMRLKKGGKLYIIASVIFAVYFSLASAFLVHMTFTVDISYDATPYHIAQLMFFALLLDGSLALMRYGNRACVEWHHLSTFPIRVRERIATELLVRLYDYKTGIYIVLAISLSLYIGIYVDVLAAILSLPLVAIAAFNGSVVISIFYRLLGNRAPEKRQHMVMLAIYPLSFFILVYTFVGEDFYKWFPVATDIGRIITAIILDDFAKAGLHATLLLLWTMIGIGILALLGRRSYRK